MPCSQPGHWMWHFDFVGKQTGEASHLGMIILAQDNGEVQLAQQSFSGHAGHSSARGTVWKGWAWLMILPLLLQH